MPTAVLTSTIILARRTHCSTAWFVRIWCMLLISFSCYDMYRVRTKCTFFAHLQALLRRSRIFSRALRCGACRGGARVYYGARLVSRQDRWRLLWATNVTRAGSPNRVLTWTNRHGRGLKKHTVYIFRLCSAPPSRAGPWKTNIFSISPPLLLYDICRTTHHTELKPTILRKPRCRGTAAAALQDFPLVARVPASCVRVCHPWT